MSIYRTSLLTTLMVLSMDSTIVLAEPMVNVHDCSPALSERLLAQTPRRQRRQAGDRGQLLERLNLTDGQKQQIAAIRQKYKAQMNQLRESLQASRQELRQMMAGTDSDAAIRAQYQEVARREQELGTLRMESMLEMREVLTPEQRSQFSQLMEQRRELYNRPGYSKKPQPTASPQR